MFCANFIARSHSILNYVLQPQPVPKPGNRFGFMDIYSVWACCTILKDGSIKLPTLESCLSSGVIHTSLHGN